MTTPTESVEEEQFWYSESQGNRDWEIASRYRKIIEYFEQNPHRAANLLNKEILTALHYKDRVLGRDEELRKRFFYAMHAADLGTKIRGAQ